MSCAVARGWRILVRKSHDRAGATGGVIRQAGRLRVPLSRMLACAALVLCAGSSPTFAVPVTVCGGDCGGDDAVTVDELITGVNIALGARPVGDCTALDLNDDGAISIDELVRAVGNALGRCPPHVEPATCEFTLPAGQTPENVACWTLRVPENRMQPDGRTVELAIAVFKSTAAEPAPDPFVFLDGGPGSPSLEELVGGIPVRVQAVRDVVYFDQRGTGLSRPSLDCPEYAQAFTDGLARAQTAEVDAADLLAAALACHDRLVGEGIDLAAYTSAATARDLQDMMQALGYQAWNLWGASYGTRVALTALRDVPQGIRSALLDSTVPVQSLFHVDVPIDLQRSLTTLFANCAADPSCAARYPDLEGTFFTLVNQLNAEPVTVTPVGPNGPFPVVFTGDRFLFAIQQALYSRSLIPLLPALISSTAAGDYLLLTQAAQAVAQFGASHDWGASYSVMCAEQVPFATPEAVAAGSEGAREEVRHFGLTYWVQLDLDVCAQWGSAAPLPVEHQPVVSAIPTLVLAGEYDPITPPDYGRLAAQTLSASSFFEFQGYAHGVLSPGCAADLLLAFLADPTQAPDASCVDALPPLGFL